jgi:hypothetical protein
MASYFERKISPDSGTASCADPQPEDIARTQAKPKRRNRVIQSCLGCRRRKTKCDRGVGSGAVRGKSQLSDRNRTPVRPAGRRDKSAFMSGTRRRAMQSFGRNWWK